MEQRPPGIYGAYGIFLPEVKRKNRKDKRNKFADDHSENCKDGSGRQFCIKGNRNQKDTGNPGNLFDTKRKRREGGGSGSQGITMDTGFDPHKRKRKHSDPETRDTVIFMKESLTDSFCKNKNDSGEQDGKHDGKAYGDRKYFFCVPFQTFGPERGSHVGQSSLKSLEAQGKSNQIDGENHLINSHLMRTNQTGEKYSIIEPDETGKKICCCQDQSSMNERACLFHEDTFCVFIHCMKRKNKICPILVDREIRK